MNDTVLLIGFEPFAGETVNPSQILVERLNGEIIGGCRVTGAVLPVRFDNTCIALEERIDWHRSQLVLGLGQAGGRAELSLERVALNLIDARIADEAGAQPVDAKVIAHAPDAYLSNLPLKAMCERMHAAGVPANLSLSAGTFVCNQAFFVLAHALATSHTRGRGGFMHVPWLPEQAVAHPGEPSMTLETMLTGIRAAIECALETREDLTVPGGTTH